MLARRPLGGVPSSLEEIHFPERTDHPPGRPAALVRKQTRYRTLGCNTPEIQPPRASARHGPMGAAFLAGSLHTATSIDVVDGCGAQPSQVFVCRGPAVC